MSDAPFTEKSLAEMAGWQAMKEARAMVEARRVLTADWKPPVLKGSVQSGSSSIRSGLVFHNAKDIENLCPCRESRQWGKMCGHSIAIGLEWLRKRELKKAAEKPKGPTQSGTQQTGKNNRAKPTKPSQQPDLRLATGDQQGMPIEVVVIFAPNMEASLPEGPVSVFFQAKSDRGQGPLNALPKGTTVSVDENDARLLQWLLSWSEGATPAMASLSSLELTQLFAALPGHPRLQIGKTSELHIDSSPWSPEIRVHLRDDGGLDLEASKPASPGVLIVGEGVWRFEGDSIRPMALSPIQSRLAQGPVRLSREETATFLIHEWPQLASRAETTADFSTQDLRFEAASPRIALRLEGGLAQLKARITFHYGQAHYIGGATAEESADWIPDPEDPRRYYTRSLHQEREAVLRLTRAGFPPPDASGWMELRGQDRVLPFFASVFPKLEKEWEVTFEARLENSVQTKIQRLEPELRAESSGEDWFSLQIEYRAGARTVSQADALQLLRSGRSHQRRPDGSFLVMDTDAIEEFEQTIRECEPEQEGGVYRIQNAFAGFLENSANEVGGWNLNASDDWRQRVDWRPETAQLPDQGFDDLEAILRHYQREGAQWLYALRSRGFGGALADEMGLGKTLQTLAFLRAWKAKANKDGSGPSLIVCPTSLVGNWLAEVAKFTPDLRAIAIRGAERQSQIEAIGDHDLAITSYALIRRDIDRYRAIPFETVILDEAQHIKNRKSQNARAVKSLKAQGRFVLTGTPLENSVLDLWSIFDFVMPQYLGSERDFKERYEIPIAKVGDSGASARLARRLRPFVLRRKKIDVASDLPEKIEQVAYCELAEAQKTLYADVLQASQKKVAATVKSAGANAGRLTLLNALLRLRQICCDPGLLPVDDAQKIHSAKRELFLELLEEALEGGHRILVFSQFVQMLRILEEELQTREIDYLYLDGSTKNRDAIVQNFQKDAHHKVFLISLKAGGVGLNLTGADTVIHYDPWWNPAVEDQATDRAHRIGQTEVVTSYKLIAKGTVEEKILKLQEKKRDLIRATLGDESRFTSSLSLEELRELLED